MSNLIPDYFRHVHEHNRQIDKFHCKNFEIPSNSFFSGKGLSKTQAGLLETKSGMVFTFFNNLTMNHIMQRSMKHVWSCFVEAPGQSLSYGNLFIKIGNHYIPASRFHNELKIIGNLGSVKHASAASASAMRTELNKLIDVVAKVCLIYFTSSTKFSTILQFFHFHCKMKMRTDSCWVLHLLAA